MNLFRAFTLFALFACVGCEDSPQVEHHEMTPEETYRTLVIANLSGDESTIRPLIIDHEHAEVLWQGTYPPAVAAALSEQYRTMKISRVGTATAKSVVLQSSAVPMPLNVVEVDGKWKVDAGPIIEFRKAAEQLKQN